MSAYKKKPMNRVYMGPNTREKCDIVTVSFPRWDVIRAWCILSWKKVQGAWKGLLMVGFLLLGILWLWFYVAILKDLPDFEKITAGFSQTTTITNRDGESLYKVFDQNRKYVAIQETSPYVVHAMIAAEDKDFWTNRGVDFNGLVRAGIRAITQGNLQGPGGSTITQQLIKNILLTSDKKITRKLKEIVLAMRIDDYLKDNVKKQNADMTSKEVEKATKEKILEMYMNYIFLGNNAYGVEAAAMTYFGKSVKDVDVLEGSLLASMPQSPSSLNPYRNVDRLMGKLVMTVDGEDASMITGAMDAAKKTFIEHITTTEKPIAASSDGMGNWLSARGDFSVSFDGKEYDVTYVPGRKDYVLSRMLEDGYIDEQQAKKAAADAMGYVFKTARVDITAPHFVFWVQEFLKTEGCEKGVLPKCFSDEELAKGGLTIKTTLDGAAQNIAEKSIIDNMQTINGYGANNSSLVYIDSRDGDVLAYVGSADYNDQDIDGNVDMVQQQRQPGSSIKPFIYTYGFMNLPLTIDTAIYDIPFKIGKDQPGNSDGGFMGPMALKKALGYSRNIPAIKMYFAVGGEEKLVPFLRDIGISSYGVNKDYGYPMAIGSAELQMLELANAYMHLSAMGRPAVINPILEIRGADGQIIYQKQPKQQQQIIPEGVAYLLRKILSDVANLPAARVNNFKVSGLTYANKSGTTNMKDINGKSLPRDGRLAGYTPSKVAIFWAGNTQGNAMNTNAYGGWVNGKTFRQFFSQLLQQKKIETEQVSPVEVKNVTVSKLSGKLSSDTTPETYRVPTMGYINTLPSAIDDTFSPLQIDKACMGKITEATPKYDILNAYIIKPYSFMPNAMDMPDITKWLEERVGQTGDAAIATGTEESYDFRSLFLAGPEEVCSNRQILTEDKTVIVSIRKPLPSAPVRGSLNVRYDVSSSLPITSVRILANDTNVGEYTYLGKIAFSDIKKVTLPAGTTATSTLTIIAINKDGGFGKATVAIASASKDDGAPYLLDDKVSVTKVADKKYTVVMLFLDDQSAVKGGKIYMKNGVLLKSFDGNIANLDIQIPQELVYEVSDEEGNTVKKTVDISVFVKAE